MTRLLLPAVAFTMLLAASSLLVVGCGERPDRDEQATTASTAPAPFTPDAPIPTPDAPSRPAGLPKKTPKPLIDMTRVSFPAAGDDTGPDSSTGEERKALAEGNNAFALDLYRRLAEKEKNNNIFFSPYSIRSALALAHAGARGETAEQMAKALRFTLPPEKLHATFAGLDRRLRRGEKFRTANAIWAQHGLPLKPDFLRLTRAGHGAGVGRVDFAGDLENARRAINKWVAEHTRDKIDELLEPNTLQPGTSLVLTNAVHLLADWESPFPRKKSWTGDFRSSDPRVSKVRFMGQINQTRYVDAHGIQAVELPYRDCNLSMVLVMPQERGGFVEMERALATDWLTKVIEGMKRERIRIVLPAFQVRAKLSPVGELRRMGMVRAFGPGANFSGISGTSMQITDVIHEAYVDVDERGTEAAAATAIIFGRSGSAALPTFYADRPFLFLIRERTTGTLLFIGRVMEPKEG